MTLSHSRWDEKAGAMCEFAHQGKASTARPGPEEIPVREFTVGESLSLRQDKFYRATHG